ncbi:hypothetical protein SAY87_007804 [Trapa incisa]|uniref:NADH-cytochrome b5 reductase n=1 Tax=Trapa incisa TaxID=236973 RepID=A0AAN7KNN7_9MYRT|nr:hypothetical protein SAY87_007804 [Trapa incisa]
MNSGFNLAWIELTDLPSWQAAFTGGPVLGVAVAVLAICSSAGCLYHRRRKPKGCLDPKKFKAFKLIKKTQISSNTARFRFALPTPTSRLGLPAGQHVVCRGRDAQGVEITRSYTPITLDSDSGHFELVVKMYPNGRMSHHFRQMRLGDDLPVRGPVGPFKYSPGQVRALGMIAGGSGITPMFQLIRAILENPKDRTSIYLVYANTTFEDILLKEEMDDLARKFTDSFKVYYVLSKPPEGWSGGTGHITKAMIQSHCPSPATNIKVLRCGPPSMNRVVAAHLDELGYTPQMQFQF